MTSRFSEDSPTVGPVAQFSLMIVPIVINCFFMVYSLVGWILEGRDKLNWSLEAVSVAVWVCVFVLAYCVLVVAFARWCGAQRWHPLVVSSVGHSVVALLLTLSVIITVRL